MIRRSCGEDDDDSEDMQDKILSHARGGRILPIILRRRWTGPAIDRIK